MSEAPPKRDAVEAVTWPVRVAAAWTWRLLIIGVGLYYLAQAFLTIELVAFSFVLALFFTAVLHPLERRLRRILPGPPSIPAALALLIGLAVLAGIGWFVSWQITQHSTQLGDQVTAFVDKVKDWLQTGPLHLKSADLDKLSQQITDAVKNNKGTLISGAITTIRTVAEFLGALLLILLSTFFLLRDGEAIWQWTLRLFPRTAHARMDVAGRVGWRTLGGYMRGQVLIALFHGISVMIVLFVLRVPLAAALGVLIFLGSFIPLIGLTVTGSLSVAVALLEHGLTAALVVAIAIVVLIQLEAHLLQPFIMSRSVAVHPLAIALAVITGTTLAGIVGALLAVPLVAFLNSTVHALRETPPEPVGDADFPVKESPPPAEQRVEVEGSAAD
ncbi:MAG TPA: AI-2E family transporter [Jatrophihabitans sp.]|jgi:predicted PurR-regulated permease PerM|uniref:AI-2E family transporter n=1 Tax=Jatrophihabitans sp. TaxID=1932789 RepID=UPI002DFCD82E|nr:AI-2E family transporter [Jatrophihabitans sp.]